MRMLMEEGRFRWFDFTEGDGQHKRQFATGAVDSVDMLLLRPTLSNFAVARTLAAWDGTIALAKRIGLKSIAGAVRR
jgi:CelD/BcsL family acetyltransferase involved in cellulose biosynthesis